MLDKKIEILESKILNHENLNSDQKEELKELIMSLKSELSELPQLKSDKETVTLNEMNLEDHGLLEESFRGINETIEEFEGSHPKLVSMVNDLCTRLSNMGI